MPTYTNKRSWHYNIFVAICALPAAHLAPLLIVQLVILAFAVFCAFQAGVIEASLVPTASDLDPSELRRPLPKVAVWTQGLFAVIYGYLFLHSESWVMVAMNGFVIIGASWYWGGSWQRKNMGLFTK